MKLLLDTSVLIDHLRRDTRATGVLRDAAIAGDELWGSVVTRTEVLRGMRSSERGNTMRLLEMLAWTDVTTEIADRAGELAHRYRASHSGIDVADFLIAATAELLPARLLTQNIRHFPMFDKLRPAYE